MRPADTKNAPLVRGALVESRLDGGDVKLVGLSGWQGPILEDTGEVTLSFADALHLDSNGLDRLLETLEPLAPTAELARARSQLRHAFAVLEETKDDPH